MRHRKADKKLGREMSHRDAMLRNMVTSLFKYDRIETTHAKAKVVRPIVEKMITLAKKGDLHSRRQALSYFKEKSVVHKLFDETTKKLKEKQSGYIQIIQKGKRKGDNAPVSIMRLLIADAVAEKPKKKAKATATKKETKPKTEKKAPQKEKKAAPKRAKKERTVKKEPKSDEPEKE